MVIDSVVWLLKWVLVFKCQGFGFPFCSFRMFFFATKQSWKCEFLAIIIYLFFFFIF